MGRRPGGGGRGYDAPPQCNGHCVPARGSNYRAVPGEAGSFCRPLPATAVAGFQGGGGIYRVPGYRCAGTKYLCRAGSGLSLIHI